MCVGSSSKMIAPPHGRRRSNDIPPVETTLATSSTLKDNLDAERAVAKLREIEGPT
jgi:hypothetical protein